MSRNHPDRVRTNKTLARTPALKKPPSRQVRRRRLARLLANDILAGRVKLVPA